MQIKNHQLYELYLCYLDSKNMSKGARSLSEISESKFYEFLKRYEFEPGFKEKWENKLLENRRDENIQNILDKEPYITFFETLDENVFVQHDRSKNIDKIIRDEFEMFFDDDSIKTIKNSKKTTKNKILAVFFHLFCMF